MFGQDDALYVQDNQTYPRLAFIPASITSKDVLNTHACTAPSAPGAFCLRNGRQHDNFRLALLLEDLAACRAAQNVFTAHTTSKWLCNRCCTCCSAACGVADAEASPLGRRACKRLVTAGRGKPFGQQAECNYAIHRQSQGSAADITAPAQPPSASRI